MGVMAVRFAVVFTVLAALEAAIGSMALRAQGEDDLTALHAQVSQLHGQGKYAEAVPLAERYVALARQKHGEEHMEFAGANAWLAFVYQAQGRYAEAEPLYKRAWPSTRRRWAPTTAMSAPRSATSQ